MSDVDHDAAFEKAFEGFGEDPKPADKPAPAPDPTVPVTPPSDDKPKEGEDNADKDKPGDKPEGAAKPDDQKPTPAEGDKPADENKPDGAEGEDKGKPGEGGQQPEEPKPLTEEGVKSIISNIRTEERATAKELDTTTQEVLEAYYPDGLSNVLVTPEGKELKTPQDVVDASNGEMDIEEAAQWLMNEQFKLDKDIEKITTDARKIAETTINFKRDSIAVLEKYEPLFKWQPSLQQKVFENLKKQVEADTAKGVVLKAPDVMEFYDFYLEPYQKAFEFSQNKPATNPAPPAPEPPKPGTEDRLDEGGDGGGGGEPDDPNNFPQQVTKELAKGL